MGESFSLAVVHFTATKKRSGRITAHPEIIPVCFRNPGSKTIQGLLHRDAVGTCRACFECRVEVQPESLVLSQAIMRHLKDVDFVVSFEVDDPGSIFIQEVICHHQSTVVVAQHDIVWTGMRTEAHNRDLLGIEAVCGVQHYDLPSHERAHN